MTDPVVEPELPALDSPPRSGVFVDHDAEPLTARDIALGNALGQRIRVDDDLDAGLLASVTDRRHGATPVNAAQQSADRLRTALLDNGVRRVSIELQVGVAGSGWGPAPFRRGMGHHIVSRPSQGLTPGLALVKRGRTGASPLTGPLCNGYGGYDLTARIITLGWANHPGTGGPWTVPGWGTVPKDNGRPYAFGWEFEGGYEPYTDEMHEFMARCGAGTLDWLGDAPLGCWDEHKGWAGPRKPDRLGYTTSSGRARIAAVRGTDNEGDDMPTAEEVARAVLDMQIKAPQESVDLGLAPSITLAEAIRYLDWNFRQTVPAAVAERMGPPVAAGAVDAVALAGALAADPAFVGSLARALRVEIDRAARDGDPATGPAT